MGIFKRMKTIAKADMNGWLDRAENPIAMLNEYSREMEQEIGKAQSALARQLFVENKQSALIVETKANVEKRSRQAKLAIEKGEETIAVLAVQEKLAQEKQLRLYEEQSAAIQEQTEHFREKLQEFQQTYTELQQKKTLLASRANVALSIKRIQTSAGAYRIDNIHAGVARAEDRILLMEAEVQAGNHLSAPLRMQETAYIGTEEVDAEIEKLKNEKALV